MLLWILDHPVPSALIALGAVLFGWQWLQPVLAKLGAGLKTAAGKALSTTGGLEDQLAHIRQALEVRAWLGEHGKPDAVKALDADLWPALVDGATVKTPEEPPR